MMDVNSVAINVVKFKKSSILKWTSEVNNYYTVKNVECVVCNIVTNVLTLILIDVKLLTPTNYYELLLIFHYLSIHDTHFINESFVNMGLVFVRPRVVPPTTSTVTRLA